MILAAMQPYSVDILNIGKNIEGDLKSFLLQSALFKLQSFSVGRSQIAD